VLLLGGEEEGADGARKGFGASRSIDDCVEAFSPLVVGELERGEPTQDDEPTATASDENLAVVRRTQTVQPLPGRQGSDEPAIDVKGEEAVTVSRVDDEEGFSCGGDADERDAVTERATAAAVVALTAAAPVAS
jgi:hypothetical protein